MTERRASNALPGLRRPHQGGARLSGPNEREVVIVRWQDGLRWKMAGYTFEFTDALDALKVGLELADAARDVLAALEVERGEAMPPAK